MDILQKFKLWKEKRANGPIPPTGNLFVAIKYDLLKQVLSSGINEKEIELTNSFLQADWRFNEIVNLKTWCDPIGAVVKIDSKKLDPKKIKPSNRYENDWLTNQHNYVYSGKIPADAIKPHHHFFMTDW